MSPVPQQLSHLSKPQTSNENSWSQNAQFNMSPELTQEVAKATLKQTIKMKEQLKRNITMILNRAQSANHHPEKTAGVAQASPVNKSFSAMDLKQLCHTLKLN